MSLSAQAVMQQVQLAQLAQADDLEKSFHLRFKCQYKEVEEKYLNKKRAQNTSCCCEPDEASTPDEELTIEDDDILFLCEEVYREDFLKFFRLADYDSNEVNNKTAELYKVCSKNKLFSLLIDDVRMHSCGLEDNECAFMQLFSYPFFHLTHECIKQLILNGAIEERLTVAIEEKVISFFIK